MSIPKLRTSGRMIVAGGLVFAALISGSSSAEAAVTHTTGYSAVQTYSVADTRPNIVTASYTVNLVKAAPKAVSLSTGVRIENYILAHDMGKPYVWGATGPYSFDCSGLLYSAARKIGDYSIPRTSEEQQYKLRYIPYAQRKPGDFVFFGRSAYHVGIYIGVRWYHGAYRSMMIDAPHTGTHVRIEPVYYSGVGYVSYGRP